MIPERLERRYKERRRQARADWGDRGVRGWIDAAEEIVADYSEGFLARKGRETLVATLRLAARGEPERQFLADALRRRLEV